MQVIVELPRPDEKAPDLLRSPLTHFLLIGIALFAVRAGWNAAPERPVVEIRRSEINQAIGDFERRSGRAASDEEVRAIQNQLIENALWLEQAWALGLQEVDPVVRRRLVQNMRFLETDLDLPEDALIARAIELGLDKSDPLIRRRMIDRVQALLRSGVRARTPDEESLRSYYQAHADRWRTPVLLDFSHVYLSRDKRGTAAESDAADLLQTLVRDRIPPEVGIELGDPFLSGNRLSGATRARIVARLGPDFADSIEGAQTKVWFGPVESAFGSHLVWITNRVESQRPKFNTIRSRVLEDWFEDETRKAIRSELAHHRERAELRILEDVPETHS